MDAWITVAVAVIVALSTLGAAFIQNKYSNRRFEMEHERAIVMYQRERRREVGSEPLLKLRAELAVMGSKLDRIVTAMQTLRPRDGVDFETSKQEYDAALEDWNTYLKTGVLSKVLFSQSDIEIVKKVEDIPLLYLASGSVQLFDNDSPESRENLKKIKEGITQIQLLINERLEGL